MTLTLIVADAMRVDANVPADRNAIAVLGKKAEAALSDGFVDFVMLRWEDTRIEHRSSVMRELWSVKKSQHIARLTGKSSRKLQSQSH